jgi:putative peptidoglycan lipid II flippase
MAPPERIARSAGVAGLATLTSRIFGLARDQVLAALFGAGNDMDAFVVAFRIPNLVRDLFAEGSMSAAFVPTFTRHLTLHGRPDAWRLGNNVITALVVATGVIVALGIVFARPIVTALAGDFGAVPGKLELTILLTRVMLPFLTLVAVAAACMGMLNSLQHYFVPALAPATFNVAIVAAAVLLVPLMAAAGWPPIVALAVGALVGGAGQIAMQWPPLRREGFRLRPVLDVRDPGLRQVLVLMGPGTLGLAATQVNLFVNTVLATGQGPGAVSWLTYAFRLMYLPIGLFGVSIATAVLPAAARHAAIDDPQAIRRTLSQGLALMIVFNVPAMLGLIALATPIVRLLFERGRFLPGDTASTAAAVQCYAVGLVGYSAARIASPVFYAIGRSRVPVAISAFSIALNVAASVLLVNAMGFTGLALGTSIAALANGGVSVWLLRRRLDGIEGRYLFTTLAKILAAALLMAWAAAASERWAVILSPGRSALMQSARLAAAVGIGLLTLAAAAKLLRIREFDEAVGAVWRRVQKLLGRLSGGSYPGT